WAAACIGLVPPLSDRLSTLGRGCGNGLKMRGAWAVAASGSAGKSGGKNFLIWGDLRSRGCCGNCSSSTIWVENE
ncbi:MAG TPA: hypothetical protein PKX73_11975, partial [Anaerohalosphaeraceae bacterium]|nr:hypothetical protein [Anaerohalosphaeraceae bacterium]